MQRPRKGQAVSWRPLNNGRVDLVINMSEGSTRRESVTAGYLLRRAVVDFGVSLVTDAKCAIMLTECLARGMGDPCYKPVPRHLGEFYKIPTIGWTK